MRCKKIGKRLANSKIMPTFVPSLETNIINKQKINYYAKLGSKLYCN